MHRGLGRISRSFICLFVIIVLHSGLRIHHCCMLISITVCSFMKNKEEFETQLFGNVLEFCLAHLEHKIHAEYV